MPVFFWDKKETELSVAQFALEMQNNAFNKEEFSDFTVICDNGKEFKVNTFFLRLHSDVLSAFLDNDSKERKSKTLTLKDLDSYLVEKMLRFMYSGKVENLDEVAEDLYMLADRYNIMKLQTLCLHNMYENLNIQNIFKRLERSFSMELPQLKTQAMNFAVANVNQLLEHQEWKNFSMENPEIVSAILMGVVKEKNTKGKNPMSWLKINSDQNQESSWRLGNQVNGWGIGAPSSSQIQPTPPSQNSSNGWTFTSGRGFNYDPSNDARLGRPEYRGQLFGRPISPTRDPSSLFYVAPNAPPRNSSQHSLFGNPINGPPPRNSSQPSLFGARPSNSNEPSSSGSGNSSS